MFEFIYSKRRLAGIYKEIRKRYSTDKTIVPLLWTEHCVECAAPICYTTCPRFKKRADGDCIRIVNGITPIKTDENVGVECEFRTWAKIESQLKIRTLTGRQYSKLYRSITHLGYFFRKLATLLPSKTLKRIIDDGWFSYRQKLINVCIRNAQPHDAVTLNGIVTNNDHPSTFLVDVKSQSALLYRKTFEVPLGKTNFKINIPPYDSDDELYFINIHPVNAEDHIKITFDELKLLPTDIEDGKKVKCVVWDLDNTLWDGVLIEGNVTPRQSLIHLVKHFDECGIINSIVSKNDDTDANDKLKELGIDEYFVFKKINWNPKSVNIANTIKQMNINPDTVVFVDDNPFERNEVKLRLPDVTCIDPSEIERFSSGKRFNAIVTEDSRKRRSTYLMLEAMHQEEEKWTGDIDDFLRSCNIRATISSPKEDEITRCYELLQRTNQLNSSGRRLSMDEVTNIINNPNFDTFVIRSSDKFGDYGIVGFTIVSKEQSTPIITDFVISCRVANKKIEPTLVNFLACKYGGKLLFNYKKTLRNGPMYSIIEELGMERNDTTANYETYLCMFDEKYPQIVTLTEEN